MADHPLRPATDHRLGRPLPYQLPNPTRAPPVAINLSRPISLKTAGLCGISRSFPRLFPTTGQVPTRYSPVCHFHQAEARITFDLHVLGMPPAFVLSQDQTLKFIPGPSSRMDPIQGPPNVRKCTNIRRPSAAVRASLPSSPQSQSTIPKGALPKRGRAYRPSRNPRQHPHLMSTYEL